MTEDFDDRLDSLEDIVRRLTGIMVEQHTMNQRVETFIESQRLFNAEIVEVHRDMKSAFERLDARMGRIEGLLERMLPGSTNGRES